MTKREKIYNKYNGKCAYCGTDLQQGWHIDHLLPLVRNTSGIQKHKYPERNNFDNLVAACPSCNNYKNSHNIEEFRRLISELRKQLMLISQYKISLRYGLITEVDKEVKFYFEEFTSQTDTPS